MLNFVESCMRMRAFFSTSAQTDVQRWALSISNSKKIVLLISPISILVFRFRFPKIDFAFFDFDFDFGFWFRFRFRFPKIDFAFFDFDFDFGFWFRFRFRTCWFPDFDFEFDNAHLWGVLLPSQEFFLPKQIKILKFWRGLYKFWQRGLKELVMPRTEVKNFDLVFCLTTIFT